jgi:O-6-methylguanine DNA methyltransferase
LLQQYFSAHKVTFNALSLPLDNLGWSEFDFSVARALAAVPYGETCSYSELAEAAGYPRAQRAVGNFLARNPFPVILPCHRIIKSNGRLGNFYSGINWKKRLLGLEQITLSPQGRPKGSIPVSYS